MGIDMATTNAPFGLQPWGKLLEAHMYCLVHTLGTGGIFHGDLVEHGGTSLATPHFGQLVEAVREEQGAAGSLLGAVIGIFDYKHDPVMYLAEGATGDSTICGYALVADHPLQQFIVQEDGDTSSLQIADIGTIRTMAGVAAGSTATGVSTMVLDSNNTTLPAVHVVGVHPDDTISAAGAAGNYCRFIVELCTHVRAAARTAI